jgi:prepilin-type N-terminal cleavage/methylation domain-containing protein
MKIESKKGFTLIEILLVLAMIALLTTIALPKVSEIYENAKLNKAKADAQIIAAAIVREELRYEIQGDSEDPWYDALVIKENEIDEDVLKKLNISLNLGDYKFYYNDGSRVIEIIEKDNPYDEDNVVISVDIPD